MFTSATITEETVENMAIAEIRQLHMFYGKKYKLGEDLEYQAEKLNVFNPQKPLYDKCVFFFGYYRWRKFYYVISSIRSVKA